MTVPIWLSPYGHWSSAWWHQHDIIFPYGGPWGVPCDGSSPCPFVGCKGLIKSIINGMIFWGYLTVFCYYAIFICLVRVWHMRETPFSTSDSVFPPYAALWNPNTPLTLSFSTSLGCVERLLAPVSTCDFVRVSLWHFVCVPQPQHCSVGWALLV